MKGAMARMGSIKGCCLGCPASALSKQTKLTGNDELFDKKVAVSTISSILGVNSLTVESYIKNRKLRED
ncbi:hypothetical protein Dfri01_46550 [Dyadobacter frigoris]|nr:hypothetical protein Dfri01_46550 [Dyadobacter frigoris]